MNHTTFARTVRVGPRGGRGAGPSRWAGPMSVLLIGALTGGVAGGLAGCGADATRAGRRTAASGSTNGSGGSGLTTSDSQVRSSAAAQGATSSGATSGGASRTTPAGRTTSVKIPTSKSPTTASSNQAVAIAQLIQEGGTTAIVVRIAKGKVSLSSKAMRTSVGQTLRLIVVSDTSGRVASSALGVSVGIVAGRPAPVDLIAVAPGGYPVTFTPSGGTAFDLVTFTAT